MFHVKTTCIFNMALDIALVIAEQLSVFSNTIFSFTL